MSTGKYPNMLTNLMYCKINLSSTVEVNNHFWEDESCKEKGEERFIGWIKGWT